jgi:hypothetical protein
MIWAVILLVALLALALAAYRIRCAWSPFTARGRRRVLYWRRTWWSGGQAENRDD